jgi:predicted transcriptional regulator
MRNSQNLNVPAPPDLVARLDERARREQRTRAQIVRMALDEYLREQAKPR